MIKSSRNKTVTINTYEQSFLRNKLITKKDEINTIEHYDNKIILGDMFQVVSQLPQKFVDLLILDPPYNLSKQFGKVDFKKLSVHDYSNYFDSIIQAVLHTLKDSATIYICGDWFTSTSLHLVASKYFQIHNRITWQREKGRGANANWKNSHEDIWFCTVSKNFTFNVDNVKTRKKVIAPYRVNGQPKDWVETKQGNFRDTFPSNFWDDITIPYWSMSENTEHPTQKPEKLLAKLMLASSNVGDTVFDPFLGSGTTSVVAKKLGRKCIAVELDEYYACVAQKRLDTIQDNTIQGYSEGVFWERNSLSSQSKKTVINAI